VGNVWILLQDYRSLCLAVVNYATVVNTHTDRQTRTHTASDQLYCQLNHLSYKNCGAKNKTVKIQRICEVFLVTETKKICLFLVIFSSGRKCAFLLLDLDTCYIMLLICCSIQSNGLQIVATVCTASCHALRPASKTASDPRQLHPGMRTSQVRHRRVSTEGQKHGRRDNNQLRGVPYDGSLQQTVAYNHVLLRGHFSSGSIFCILSK